MAVIQGKQIMAVLDSGRFFCRERASEEEAKLLTPEGNFRVYHFFSTVDNVCSFFIKRADERMLHNTTWQHDLDKHISAEEELQQITGDIIFDEITFFTKAIMNRWVAPLEELCPDIFDYFLSEGLNNQINILSRQFGVQRAKGIEHEHRLLSPYENRLRAGHQLVRNFVIACVK